MFSILLDLLHFSKCDADALRCPMRPVADAIADERKRNQWRATPKNIFTFGLPLGVAGRYALAVQQARPVSWRNIEDSGITRHHTDPNG